YTRNQPEQVEEIDRARREHLIAIPVILRADPDQLWELGVRERRLDRVLRDLRRVAGRVRVRRVPARGIRARGVARSRNGLRSRGPAEGEREQHHPRRAPNGAAGDRQRALPRTSSTNVPTGTPVGPLGTYVRSDSEYAVPAMSRCTHAKSSANSLRNIAAVHAPAGRPPVFLMSATSLLM